jgi:hypothetical protein
LLGHAATGLVLKNLNIKLFKPAGLRYVRNAGACYFRNLQKTPRGVAGYIPRGTKATPHGSQKGKTMYDTCHHVMPSGLPCQSPAMRGYAFCYHHARRAAASSKAVAAEPRATGSRATESQVDIPSVLDRNGITQAIGKILQALGSGRISPRRASILLYGLQMAVVNPQPNAAATGQLPSELLLAFNAALGLAPAVDSPNRFS